MAYPFHAPTLGDRFRRFDDALERGVERWKGPAKSFWSSSFNKRGIHSARDFIGLGPIKPAAERTAAREALAAKYPWKTNPLKRAGGHLASVGGRLLGLGFAGYAAYEGYKEGGILGAAGGVAKTAAEGYAFGALGIPLLKAAAVAALVGGVAYGAASAAGVKGLGWQGIFKSNVERWRAEHKSVNMGTPVEDPYGTGATMRQRAIQAIHGSRINGMNALGNEASLTYTSYFR